MTVQDAKWAVVLGVTGGTGGAAATALAKDPGLNVFGMHRGHWAEEAKRVEDAVTAAGRRCHLRVADAGSYEHVVEAVDELAQVAGPGSVKVLVHAIANASYGTFLPSERWGGKALRPDQVDKTFASMAHSFVWWAQELNRRGLLAEDGARLVALTNPMVESVVHGWGLVAATKAALDAYVRHLGFEMGPAGHRVVLVKFGLVETHAVMLAFKPEQWSRIKAGSAGNTPHQRLCTVEEVARFLSYLAGPGGEWFNAGMVDLTGGQSGALLDDVFYRKEWHG
ncbi:MAG: SDR family oxidoreductase [Deltaproteobacteria bacterium]|nr:SDR family oxidoreductase [Deltaproteobacteria bacterium]